MTIRRHYVDVGGRQIHFRRLMPGRATAPPLICLHPAPSSGLYFETVMPLLAKGRDVFAPDYPGYGSSDAADEQPTIEDFAAAIAGMLDALNVRGAADILGFHTGCLVGAELALTTPERVNHLVLCDVPYFDAATRQTLGAKMGVPMGITTELECLEKAWSFNVGSRVPAVDLDRAFALFAEHLRAGDNDHRAFAAAFAYDVEARLAALQHPTSVIATTSGLRDATIAASQAIDGATFIDAADITTAVFETHAQDIANTVLSALEAA